MESLVGLTIRRRCERGYQMIESVSDALTFLGEHDGEIRFTTGADTRTIESYR